jgi:hypothetical protein
MMIGFDMVELSHSTPRRAKMQAAKEGMTIQAVVTKAITEYLERVGG